MKSRYLFKLWCYINQPILSILLRYLFWFMKGTPKEEVLQAVSYEFDNWKHKQQKVKDEDE